MLRWLAVVLCWMTCVTVAYGDMVTYDAPQTAANAIPHHEPRNRFANPPFYVVNGHRYVVMASAHHFSQTGVASWYGTDFHKKHTSSGEPYNMYAMTAAHKTLPIPSYAKVTNLQNHRSIIVRVNDRGPFHDGRIIDLSFAAASRLGFARKGTTKVRIEAIDPLAMGKQQTVEVPKIYLQVGAYSKKNSAQTVLDKAQRVTGAIGVLASGVAANKPIYRVQLGPFKSFALFETARKTLVDAGYASLLPVVAN